MTEVVRPAGAEEGKFNAGLDTLEDISLILKDIRALSVNYHHPQYQQLMTLGKAQHMKYKLCRFLFIRAQPLIKSELRPSIKTELGNLKVSWLSGGTGTRIDAQSGNAVPKGYYEAYNPNYDEALDTLIENIINALQESGRYFMPGKSESKLF